MMLFSTGETVASWGLDRLLWWSCCGALPRARHGSWCPRAHCTRWYQFSSSWIRFGLHQVHLREVLFAGEKWSASLLRSPNTRRGRMETINLAAPETARPHAAGPTRKVGSFWLGLVFVESKCTMGTHISFIFRGYNPYIGGVKPSNFMVLGSHGNLFLGLIEKISFNDWLGLPRHDLQVLLLSFVCVCVYVNCT